MGLSVRDKKNLMFERNLESKIEFIQRLLLPTINKITRRSLIHTKPSS